MTLFGQSRSDSPPPYTPVLPVWLLCHLWGQRSLCVAGTLALQVADSFLVWKGQRRGGRQRLPPPGRHTSCRLCGLERRPGPQLGALASPQASLSTAPLLWTLPSADNHQPVLTAVSPSLPGPTHGTTWFWFLRVWWAEGRGTFIGVTWRPSATPWRPLPPPVRFPKKLPFALFAPLIHSGRFSGLNCWRQVGSLFTATHTHEG